MVAEEWRAIKGYEGLYEVSSLGRVRSLGRVLNYLSRGVNVARRIPSRIMSQANSSNGYKQVTLCDGDRHTIFRVHRLVAIAFLPNPSNYPEVNHKDEDKTNNSATNLEWCNHIYNSRYGNKPPRGEKNGMAKLSLMQVKDIRKRRRNGEPLKTIASDYGVSVNHVCNIAKGKRWADE